MRRHNQDPPLRRPCAGWTFRVGGLSSSALVRHRKQRSTGAAERLVRRPRGIDHMAVYRADRKSLLLQDAAFRVASAILPLLDGMEQEVVQCVPICYRRNLTAHALAAQRPGYPGVFERSSIRALVKLCCTTASGRAHSTPRE